MPPPPIHLNTAGAGLPPSEVTNLMCAYLQQEAAMGAYETEQAFAGVLEHAVYEAVAELVNARTADIALFDSATRAWHGILRLCMRGLGMHDRVWITPYEYAGNLIALIAWQREFGFKLELIPLDGNGDIDLAWMRENIDGSVALVSIVHIPSGCGVVAPVAEIADIVAGQRCWFVIDACQSVGQIDIDVAALRCDVLTAAGRKFLRGPRGTAFAYISPRFRSLITPDFSDLHVARVNNLNEYQVHSDGARIFELAERGMAASVGLNAAVRHHMAADRKAGPAMFSELVDGLARLDGVRLIAPGTRQSGIACFQHATRSPAEIVAGLSARGFNAWVMMGHHTPIAMKKLGVASAVRLSVHHSNTRADIACFLEEMPSIVE